MVTPVIVRQRGEADSDACVEMALAVHERDGYPLYLPTDLHAFVVSADALAAWVAERSGEILGHVALHRRSAAPILAVAGKVLRQPPSRLGVVARLFVSPSAHRSGAGRALLDVASRDAAARGLWPILDVATGLHAAIAMYEKCGWKRIGELTVRFGDDTSLDEFVYRGPVSLKVSSCPVGVPPELGARRAVSRAQSVNIPKFDVGGPWPETHDGMADEILPKCG